jgi:WD40 repeat protein
MLRHRRRIEFDAPVSALAVSSDGSLVVAAHGDGISLIDVESGRQAGRVDAEQTVTGLSLSLDPRLLGVATGSPSVRVSDWKTGETLQVLDRTTAPDFLRQQPQVQVAFLPHSHALVTRGDNSDVTVWNVETGNWEHLFRMPHIAGVIAVSPDGRHLAMVSMPNPKQYSGHVTVYRFHHGLEWRWNNRHESERGATCAAFSPDSSLLATCGAGDGVRIWDVESGAERFHLPEPRTATYRNVAFVNDAEHLLTLSSKVLELRRLGDPRPLSSADIAQAGEIRALHASTDGKVVATLGAAAIDVWTVTIDE